MAIPNQSICSFVEWHEIGEKISSTKAPPLCRDSQSITVALSWHAAHELALSLPEEDEQRALVKLSPADQAALTMSDSATFSAAPHWGQYGWTYVQIATVDESTLRDLFYLSWRNVAPKELVAVLDSGKQ